MFILAPFLHITSFVIPHRFMSGQFKFLFLCLRCLSSFVNQTHNVSFFAVCSTSEKFRFLVWNANTYHTCYLISNCLWRVIFDNHAKKQPFPTKIWCWTRCSIIIECSLTEINLRRANGLSPVLESALIDWPGVLFGTEQSWNNYSNLRVEWWSSMWSGAEVSGTQHWSACHNKERQ